MTAELVDAVRLCGGCRSPLERRENERSNRWLSRHHCSPGCAGAVRAARNLAELKANPGPVQTKLCAGCDATIRRDPPEAWTNQKWANRKFHSTACSNRARTGKRMKPGAPRKRAAKVESKTLNPPVAAPIVAAPVSPPWRPPGFSAEVNVWAGHRRAG